MQNMTPKLRDLALFIMWSDHTGGEAAGGGGGLKLYIMDLGAKTKIWNTQVYHLIIIVFWDEASALNINSGNVIKEPSDT